ncbi:MAG: Chromosome (plasmid) partitioning protein ParB [uncultured Sulfurovum sp.]|uniref:Chromosome (Plasmid) partitioning protein ParB n=1 Tax=uncultured Sulfurovum sp. TaxID=269237 RepID=A0A6S6SX81_9BACT|nr:MAG: Chromosome (plasmid) partitioning protein ParB [uncultured Sulfurovum sp.]
MALGRGLGSILDEVGKAYESEMGTSSYEGELVREIDVNEISPNPYQPRKNFSTEALQELSNSILRHGLLQPIVVIEKDDGYLLVAGERRLRAHKLAKLESIRCVIADVDIDDVKLRELALVENIQRENLNAIELANSYDELIKVYEITHDELSNIVHKSRSQITNTLRLLALSSYVQEKLTLGIISQGHAKVLIGFDEKEQKVLLDTIVGQKLSVRESELLVKKKKTLNRDEPILLSKKAENFVNSYEKKLQEKIPFGVKVKNNSLEISFKNSEEVEIFLNMLPK